MSHGNLGCFHSFGRFVRDAFGLVLGEVQRDDQFLLTSNQFGNRFSNSSAIPRSVMVSEPSSIRNCSPRVSTRRWRSCRSASNRLSSRGISSVMCRSRFFDFSSSFTIREPRSACRCSASASDNSASCCSKNPFFGFSALHFADFDCAHGLSLSLCGFLLCRPCWPSNEEATHKRVIGNHRPSASLQEDSNQRRLFTYDEK